MSLLCFDNLLERGTVVASSEDASFPVANAYDWNTADYFKPAASGTINIDLTLSTTAPANYLAFYNQNLYSLGGSIKLQYWNGTIYVDASSTISPTDNSPRIITFTSRTSTKWRLVITCASVFSLGVVSFGTSLAMQYGMYLGWTPPVLARATQITNNISVTGQFLGRSVFQNGVVTNLILQYAQDSWVRTNWLPFIKRIEQKPFFWLPNETQYPLEAVLCQTQGEIPPPTHTQYGFMGTEIPVRGLVE